MDGGGGEVWEEVVFSFHLLLLPLSLISSLGINHRLCVRNSPLIQFNYKLCVLDGDLILTSCSFFTDRFFPLGHILGRQSPVTGRAQEQHAPLHHHTALCVQPLAVIYPFLSVSIWSLLFLSLCWVWGIRRGSYKSSPLSHATYNSNAPSVHAVGLEFMLWLVLLILSLSGDG